jgi:hypothetical protein
MTRATRRGIEDNVLSSSEIAANRKVANVYSLQRADFATEAEYDDFLEERENAIFAFAHNINIPEAEANLAAFREKNRSVIEGRNAEKMQLDPTKKPRTLPLLTQLKFQTPANIQSSSKMAMRSIQYSDASYCTEIQQRLEKWEENANVPVHEASGMLESWRMLKAKHELRTSLFGPA